MRHFFYIFIYFTCVSQFQITKTDLIFLLEEEEKKKPSINSSILLLQTGRRTLDLTHESNRFRNRTKNIKYTNILAHTDWKV